MLGKAAHVGQPAAWFVPPHLLDDEAARTFGWLHAADLLCGLGQVEFAHQAARLLAEINKLHPFREGNGRTDQGRFQKRLEARLAARMAAPLH
jgi:cell filamentation protein